MKKYEREEFGMKNIEVVKFVERADNIKGMKDKEAARSGIRRKGAGERLESVAAVACQEGSGRGCRRAR